MAYLVWVGYHDAIRAARTATFNYAAIIEARLDATLRRADADLQAILRDLPDAAFKLKNSAQFEGGISARLHGLRNSFTEIADFVVVDRDGNRLYTTAPQKAQRVNVSSEKYFAQLRDSARDGIVISEVIVSRSSGKLIVVVARPARDGQGAFQGAALATLKIDEFENLFRTDRKSTV